MKTTDKLITVVLVLFFGFAGIDKLFHLHGFIHAIDNYRILPLPLGPVLAPVIIAAEMAIAAGLLIPSWRRIAALQATVLLTIFTIALLVNAALGARGICGCWFSIDMAGGRAHVVLNLALIAMTLLFWHSLGQSGGAREAGAADGAKDTEPERIGNDRHPPTVSSSDQ